MGWCDGTMLGQLGRGEDFQGRQWGTCKGFKVSGWLRDTRTVSVRSNGDVFRGVKDQQGSMQQKGEWRGLPWEQDSVGLCAMMKGKGRWGGGCSN